MSSITRLHAHLRAQRIAHRDVSDRLPASMMKPKAYARMERLVLPQPTLDVLRLFPLSENIPAGLADPRDYPLQVYGDIFGVLKGVLLEERAASPSGAYSSIEVYLLSEATSFKGSVMHYDPTSHALERLWPLTKGLSLDDLYLDSPDLICFNLIVLTAVWPGLYSASGEYAYNKALLRAGQLSETVRLAAHTLGLPFHTIEEYDDQMLLRVLDIDPETESALMMIAI